MNERKAEELLSLSLSVDVAIDWWTSMMKLLQLAWQSGEKLSYTECTNHHQVGFTQPVILSRSVKWVPVQMSTGNRGHYISGTAAPPRKWCTSNHVLHTKEEEEWRKWFTTCFSDILPTTVSTSFCYWTASSDFRWAWYWGFKYLHQKCHSALFSTWPMVLSVSIRIIILGQSRCQWSFTFCSPESQMSSHWLIKLHL